MTAPGKKSLWYMAAPFALVLLTTLALTSLNGLSADVHTATRLAGLLGYQLIFVAVLSSAFTRPLIRAFGRPFVTMHHLVAISGLVIIIVHPLLASIAWGDRSILRPRLDSWGSFVQWGGSPALDLLVIAVLGAVLRKRLKSVWPVVHALTFVAFVLATAHAATAPFTTDLQAAWARAIAWLLAGAAVAVLVLRRTLLKPKRRPAR